MMQMEKTRPIVRNGIDVSALMETVAAVKANPALSDFRFRASNMWMGGDRNRSTIRSFYGAGAERIHAHGPFMMENNEPPVLLGEGKAANPVEYVLHALAGCLTTTMTYHAAARGIVIDEISSELEGDLDLRGFLGLDPTVRKGFSTVRVTMKVKSAAPVETLNTLAQFSPVYDIVSKSLPVEVSVEAV